MPLQVEVMKQLGFRSDPFHGYDLDTLDNHRVKDAVGYTIFSRRMIVIHGRRGIGKTRSVEKALADLEQDGQRIRVIRPARVDVEAIRPTDIIQAIIHDLGNGEKPRQTKEARQRQVNRLLSAAHDAKEPVCLLFEEAHVLHATTLLALKRVREVSRGGIYPLLSCILVGQRNPMLGYPSLDEVRLRSDDLVMTGPSKDEIKQAVMDTVGGVFEEEAINTACQSDISTWVDLQQILSAAMARAVANGRAKVNVEDVITSAANASASGDQLPLWLRFRNLRMSTRTIARDLGISPSTVDNVVFNRLAAGQVPSDQRQQIIQCIAKEEQRQNKDGGLVRKAG